jgi:hypothetical protein
LLREAVEIDGQSKDAVEAFRRLGFRHNGRDWVEARSTPDPRLESDAPDLTDPLIGLTQEEILAQLGKPLRRSVSITQGSVLLQWTYQASRGGTLYINFVRRAGAPATVVSRYVIP